MPKSNPVASLSPDAVAAMRIIACMDARQTRVIAAFCAHKISVARDRAINDLLQHWHDVAATHGLTPRELVHATRKAAKRKSSKPFTGHTAITPET